MVLASGVMDLLTSIVPSTAEPGSVREVLEGTPLSTSACCGRSPVDFRGGGDLVGGARPVSGEVAGWCWDSSHPVVFALSAFVGGISFFGASGRV